MISRFFCPFPLAAGASVALTDEAAHHAMRVLRLSPGDALVFGCETKGLPDELLAAHADSACGIPILTQHVRSLNLSSAVAVVVYEALRQIDARP